MSVSASQQLYGLRALLLDADDTLVPSEAPAFEASADVTNRFLAACGIDRRVTGEELRGGFTDKNFRTTAAELAAAAGMDVPDLDAWVAEEKRLVTAHLSAVSSSALTRLDGSFRAAGLADLLAPSRRFSAEDSLPTPTSKPDPAVYLHACRELGIEPAHGLAVEDSVPGATSAVRAGCPTVGIVAFVPEAERGDRRRQLEEAGVLVVVESWPELGDLLFAASAAPGPG